MATHRGIRLAQIGLLVNGILAATKLAAGVLGNSYALIADATESFADLFSSLVVWGGVAIAAREPDESHPFGHGRAEALAAAIVALMLVGAAIAIGVASVKEIITPHHLPAPYTLIVLVAVILVKEALFRFVLKGATEIESTAVAADAWHHRSDAITSAAAFIGISIALIGGQGWESADDYAAVFAALIILYNGIRILKPVVDEMMDRAPDRDLLERVTMAAMSVPGVLATEKLRGRKSGPRWLFEIHVQADPMLSLHDAHELGHTVKAGIMSAAPAVGDVLVHMEPFERPKDLTT
ncbi:MAG TPA: cation diffusion facilitator family transporter [Gemmatimonadales bacterium]|nr:cation diffusion facilitator family transporter [Gemmatimonadales bacterium]